MKTDYFILLVIVISIILNYACYSAKDTLPPNPTFLTCPYCGEFSGELVEDMPKDSTRSNLGTIVFDTLNSYNIRFNYEDFIPGEYPMTHWAAWIYDHSKDSRLVVTFTDFAGNDTTIQVYYYAANLEIKPNLDYGIVPVGEVKEMECWLINKSSIREDSIDTLIFKNETEGFEILDITYPFIIKPLDSIKFRVRFTASKIGEFYDTLNLKLTNDDWAGYRKKACILVNVGSARIDVSNWDYGDVPVNSAANGAIEIRNIGSVDLIITGYTGPRRPYIFIPDLYIDPNRPLRITPGQVLTYEVRFLPLDTIKYTDSMYFISNSVKLDVDSVGELNGRGYNVEDVKVQLNDNIKISFSPNPADDYLTIDLQNIFRKPDFIRLLDYYGNVVYENKKIDDGNFKIKTSELASGMYMLQIGSGGGVMTSRKIVVVH